MGGPRTHDYALLAKILRNEPHLEQRLRALAARYTELHPKHLRITREGLRNIFANHSEEILGRPRRPGVPQGRGGTVRHNYQALRDLVAEQPHLAKQRKRLAELYELRTGRAIHENYVRRALAYALAEVQPPEESPQSRGDDK